MSSPIFFTLKPSTQTLEYWMKQDFAPSALQENPDKIVLLLTPRFNHIDDKFMWFPEGTEDFYNFIRTHNMRQLKIDICVEDCDYKELGLHSDVQTLPDIVMLYFVAPVVAGLVVEYIKSRFGSRQHKTIIKSKVTITKGEPENAFTFDYEGLASDYEKTMGATLRRLSDSNVFDQLEDTKDLDYEQRLERLASYRNEDENI